MSVGGIAIGQFCIPLRSAEDNKTKAGYSSTLQEIIQTVLNGCFDACFYSNAIGIVSDASLIGMGICANLNILAPVSTQCGNLHIHGQERTLCHGADIADIHTLFGAKEHNGFAITVGIQRDLIKEYLDLCPFSAFVNSQIVIRIVPFGVEPLVNDLIRGQRAV